VQSGDPTALEQAANEMVVPFQHPSQFVQEHPFQALLSLSGLGRAAGAAAGAGARAGIAGERAAAALSGRAPRDLVSPEPAAVAGTDATPVFRTINEGTYSRNATEQLVQRLRDAAASHSTPLFDRRIKRQGQQSIRLRQALKNENTRTQVNPVAEASRRASPEERTAAIYAGGPSGQGLRPSDLVTHYQDEVALLQEELHAATGTHRGQVKRNLHYAQGALDSWRGIYEKLGDDITPHMQALQQAVQDAVAGREQELADLGLLDPEQMAAARQQPQDIILNPDEARPANPFYVPHRPLVRGRERVMPRRSTSILAAREGTIHGRTGHLLKTGNLDLSMRPVIERLAQPGDAAAAAHFLNDIRAKHGVHVSPGDAFDPSREQLISATTNAEAAMTDGYDVLRANIPKQHSAGVVPEGDWMLVPKPLWDERIAHFAPQQQGSLDRFGHELTNAFRWYALSARPAWLASNIVGNTAQAFLGGVGPVSAYRAIDKTKGIGKHLPGRDYGDVIPATVPFGGMVTQMLAPRRGLLPRSDRLPQNPLRAANVTTENWARRALYLRHAIPEYGHDIESLVNAKTAEERAPRVVKIVDRFLGQFGHGKGRYVALVPFLGWLTFITKHTLIDLPIHHPARALLLARLGDLGNAGAGYEGLLNSSLQGAIPAGEGDQGPVGPTTNFVRTGALNPWATITQLANFDPREPTGQPNFAGAVGAINPFGQIAYAAATGHELDAPQFTGPTTLSPEDRGAYILGQLLGTVPFTRVHRSAATDRPAASGAAAAARAEHPAAVAGLQPRRRHAGGYAVDEHQEHAWPHSEREGPGTAMSSTIATSPSTAALFVASYGILHNRNTITAASASFHPSGMARAYSPV
jgi:hypothetical protein